MSCKWVAYDFFVAERGSMAFAFFRVFNYCSVFNQLCVVERLGKNAPFLKGSFYKMFHVTRTISGG